jgi:hypothetical protein
MVVNNLDKPSADLTVSARLHFLAKPTVTALRPMAKLVLTVKLVDLALTAKSPTHLPLVEAWMDLALSATQPPTDLDKSTATCNHKLALTLATPMPSVLEHKDPTACPTDSASPAEAMLTAPLLTHGTETVVRFLLNQSADLTESASVPAQTTSVELETTLAQELHLTATSTELV